MLTSLLPLLLLASTPLSESRRCYSCYGGHCSYKIPYAYPSVECGPEFDMCQSLCYNGTVNVHRCANVKHDCTSVRGKDIYTTLAKVKRNYVVQNEEGEEHTVNPDEKVHLRITDCFLCKDALCNFNYLCDNLKNALDYEENNSTLPGNHTKAKPVRQRRIDASKGCGGVNKVPTWRGLLVVFGLVCSRVG